MTLAKLTIWPSIPNPASAYLGLLSVVPTSLSPSVEKKALVRPSKTSMKYMMVSELRMIWRLIGAWMSFCNLIGQLF